MSEEIKDQPPPADPKAPAEVGEAASAEVSDAPTEVAEGTSQAADESTTSVQRSEDDDAALDAEGRERPRFLLGFPPHPGLARLAAAFEAGNYALVRAEAEALAERAESPAVRAAALELRRRIAPDPLAKYLLALTAALLLSLAYFAYHH